MEKILLVEDNVEYANVAMKYLISINQDVTLVSDYSHAIDELKSNYFKEVITDCFMPETTGTENIGLGKQLIKEMAKSNPYEQKRIKGLKLFGEFLDLNDSKVKQYVEYLILNASEENMYNNSIYKLLKLANNIVNDSNTSINITDFFKESLNLENRIIEIPKNNFEALREAMSQSESNQPLGLLIAKKSYELGLPFILNTSTDHHDILTKPVQTYAHQQGWKFIDCMRGTKETKTSPQFWENVFNQLSR